MTKIVQTQVDRIKDIISENLVLLIKIWGGITFLLVLHFLIIKITGEQTSPWLFFKSFLWPGSVDESKLSKIPMIINTFLGLAFISFSYSIILLTLQRLSQELNGKLGKIFCINFFKK